MPQIKQQSSHEHLVSHQHPQMQRAMSSSTQLEVHRRHYQFKQGVCYNVGPMAVCCFKCSAPPFATGRTTQSSLKPPQFIECCQKRLALQHLPQELHAYLQQYLTISDSTTRAFCANISRIQQRTLAGLRQGGLSSLWLEQLFL